MSLTWRGHLTPADAAASSYLYLRFEVPAGTTRVSVSYEFDRSGGSILDLGLLDPEAAPFPARTGFRGWSGSARREAFVTAEEATPGYLPGAVQPGRWQVMLGLARIGPAGCDYSVTVELDDNPGEAPARPAPRPARAAPRPTRAKAAEARWYRGDLQSHTYYSDARGSPTDLVNVARDRGLEFLAVTDHNTNGHHRALAELESGPLLLVPGEEVTTYRGHANVWGVAGWVDFRLRTAADLDRLIADVHGRGGLFSVNHPKATPDCLGCDWEYPVPAAADALEAWQGPWPHRNWESLARYDAELRRGRRLALVGGSDRHQPGYPDTDPAFLQVGSPTTWLHLPELSVPAVLAAIRAGRAFVSEGPAGPRLELDVAGAGMGATARTDGRSHAPASARVSGAIGDLLVWVGSAGVLREVEVTQPEFTDTWDCPLEGGYVRVEVVAKASLPSLAELAREFSPETIDATLRHPWRRALSNPVYLERLEAPK